MKWAFTLVELLVVIAIISILMALGLPVMNLARQHAAEAVCRSNLRQMALILKTYCSEHDNLFPQAQYIYHSKESFITESAVSESVTVIDHELSEMYPPACRWHDARIGLDSPLLRREHPEFQGSLWPYLGDKEIVRCKTGARAFREGGCNCPDPDHPSLIEPQYTYAMNALLYSRLTTGKSAADSASGEVDMRTVRKTEIRKETQVTRSPSEVFAFGEENSWSVNVGGSQPPYRVSPGRAELCNLSGPHGAGDPFEGGGGYGAIYLGSMRIEPSWQITSSPEGGAHGLGDAFATYHRAKRGDVNTGHSYVSMLDGHVQRVTVSDQLRASRRDPNLPKSRLGPGGNVYLAWPLDIPPVGGWESQ